MQSQYDNDVSFQVRQSQLRPLDVSQSSNNRKNALQKSIQPMMSESRLEPVPEVEVSHEGGTILTSSQANDGSSTRKKSVVYTSHEVNDAMRLSDRE